MAPVLPIGNHLNLPFTHQVPKTDITEELMNLITEIRPQVVGQAFLAILAITLVAATGGIQDSLTASTTSAIKTESASRLRR